MSNVVVAELVPISEARVVLEDVKVDSTLRGLCSETLMTQSYRNLEERNIEAVYTFPLPLDAVLLELTLELNGKILRGFVSAKKEAEERYEEAIESGDSAVLLRQVEPGIYSVSVGNILPGERAIVRYRYSQLHCWQGDSLRFQLPTTIAPRYGDPLASGMAMHEVPGYSLTIDHGFVLELRIEGALAQADFECPSHPIGISQDEGARVFRLAGGAGLMDSDFVLILKEPAQAEPQGNFAPDKDAYVAQASFHPCYPGEPEVKTGVIKLVVDCSGSMNGDSMRQAKAAVREILESLRKEDQFNITTFGSYHRLLFSKPKPADLHNLQIAQQFVEIMDADMGGTEIGEALQASFKARANKEEVADVLLITDGEVWNQEEIIQEAKRSGHRIFSVGVGNAVSEGFVREIAAVTGGASELVSPREQMAEHIVRHFQRVNQPRATVIEVDWSGETQYQSPEIIQGVYSGDTLHLFARFDEPPSGPVVLKVTYADRKQAEHPMDLLPADEESSFHTSLPRLAANARLEALNDSEAQKLAVEYQLVTDQTSCVLVYERDVGEKSDGSPELHKVPQMMAAGWGGIGSVDGRTLLRKDNSTVCFSRKPALASADMDFCDVPAFLRRATGEGPGLMTKAQRKKEFIDVLDLLPFSILETLRRNGIKTIGDLIKLTQDELLTMNGLDEADVIEIIEALKVEGWRLKKQGMAGKISSVFQR